MVNSFENISIIGDKGYFFSYEANGLFELDLNTFSCRFLVAYEKDGAGYTRLFANTVAVNEWIVMVPTNADCFMTYNRLSGEIKYLDIPKIECDYKRTAKFLSGHAIGDSAYVIGHSYPGIVKISPSEGKTELIADCSKYYKRDNSDRDAFRYSKHYGDTIYIPSACDSSVWLFNVKTEKMDNIEIQTDAKGFGSVFKRKDFFILISLYDNRLFEWDGSKNVVTTIPVADDSKKTPFSDFTYSNSVSINEDEIIIPMCNNKIVVYRAKESRLKLIDIDEIKRNYEEIIAPVRSIFVYQNNAYAVSGYSGEVFLINVTEGKIELTNHKIKSDMYLNVENKLFDESTRYDVKDFVEDICSL